MSHIPYVDPETLSDPYDAKLHERARLHGTPRPSVSLTAGAQRWVRTLDLEHRQVLGDTDAGLAVDHN